MIINEKIPVIITKLAVKRSKKYSKQTHLSNLGVIIESYFDRAWCGACRFSKLSTNYCRFGSHGIATYQFCDEGRLLLQVNGSCS